jgi:hypothetical protein
MVSSRAWFALAVAGVLGLFYLAYGLQSGPAMGIAYGQENKGKWIAWEHSGVTPNANGPRFSRFYRTKVPNGWLVFVTAQNADTAGHPDPIAAGLAFVPDPEHKWDGNSLP